MKTIQEIYNEYRIMPNLQLHQLRVAAVAQRICDHFQGELRTRDVIKACLTHDMGNIIKSDFDRFPEFLKPEGREYWQEVKDAFLRKYGSDENAATKAIASEIGLDEGASSCLQRIGFRNVMRNEADDCFEFKICNYADMRVGPHGVLSLDERAEEGRKRYEHRVHAISDRAQFDASVRALKNMEAQIFARTDLKPEDITDQAISAELPGLRKMPI